MLNVIKRIVQSWLGVDMIKERLDNIADRLDMRSQHVKETKMLSLLEKPMTTQEIADAMKLSRSRTSEVLNNIERSGKVRECGKRGRKLLYKRSK